MASDQQYRVVADWDKGDDPTRSMAKDGDLLIFRVSEGGGLSKLVRIERLVPTTDEPQKPELVTLHLYRDTCAGGLFLSERELERTLHEHVESLTIRRDRLPAPSLPTREQIAEAITWAWKEHGESERLDLDMADAVLALLQKGADQ